MSKAVLDVIGDIYEAAYRPEHWEVALKHICHLVEAKSAGLFVKTHGKKRTVSMYGYGIPKAGIFAYNHGLANLDPAFKIMMHEPEGKARNILNPDEPEFKHGLYHKLMNKPVGIHYVGGMNIFNDESWIVGLGLHRGEGAGVFEEYSLQVLDDLVPHMQRAIRIQQEFTRLRLRERALTEGLSRLALGVVLLDANGFPVYVNPVARSILESHPAVNLSKNGISADAQEQNRILQQTLNKMIQASLDNTRHPEVTLALLHADRELPLTVMLAPYANLEAGLHDIAGDARILMYLSDPSASTTVSVDTLHALYGLTESEAMVAIGIANGFTLEQIADMNNVSQNTVKTQLKSVFRKTNCNRQPELVSLLLRTPQMHIESTELNLP